MQPPRMHQLPPPSEFFAQGVCCCINLDRRPDRWDAFRTSWRDAGIPGEARRVSAVDLRGRAPPCTFRGNAGAWGCLQSHLSLYRTAIGNRAAHAVSASCMALNATLTTCAALLVFEDDAQFVPNFADQFAAFLQELPNDWQLAYLGGNHHFYGALWPTPISPCVARCRCTLTTHAYAIREGAMQLVLSLPPTQPIDVLLCEVQRRLPTYCATPDLVTQAAGPSDVCGGGVDYGHIWRTQADVFAGA